MYISYMGELMNSSMGVKSGVSERVSISCYTCDPRHDSPMLLGIIRMPQLVNKSLQQM